MFSCDEPKEVELQGCCYWKLEGPNNSPDAWNCIATFETNCDVDDENIFVDGSCSAINYCTQSSCENINCEWIETDSGIDWCECP